MGVKAPEKPLNIRELVIDEPRANVGKFDARKNISDSDWEIINEHMREYKGIVLEKPPIVLQDMLYLFPNSKARVDSLVSNLKIETDYPLDANHLVYLEAVKTVMPDSFKELTSATNILDLRAELQREIDAQNFNPNILRWFAIFKRIFPTVPLDFSHHEESIFNRFKDLAHVDFSSKWFESNYTQQLEMFANLKIVFPDLFKEEQLPKDFWQKAKDRLLKKSELTSQLFFHYTQTVFNLTILAADEVKFTDKGMEVVMNINKEYDSDSIPELPETRQF